MGRWFVVDPRPSLVLSDLISRWDLILPGVTHIDFVRFTDMTKGLGRVQAYAEDLILHKTVFSWPQLEQRWGGGYLAGFNIPGWAFEPFFDGRFQLTQHEEFMIKALRDSTLNIQAPFYILATASGDARGTYGRADGPHNGVLMHEIAHALWYTNEQYQQECKAVIESMPSTLRASLLDRLTGWGIYHPSVLDDELHAYLATAHAELLVRGNSIKETHIHDYHIELRNILARYVNLNAIAAALSELGWADLMAPGLDPEHGSSSLILRGAVAPAVEVPLG
jgi:hypothetical protein